MGRRPKDPWFTEEGRPILRDGLYRNTPGGDFHFDFRQRGHQKGSTGTAIEKVARAYLAGLRQRLKDEAHGRAEPAAPTLEKLWEDWDRLKAPTVSKSHQRYMAGVVHQHTGAYLKRPATELTQAAFEELRLAYLTGHGQGYLRNGAPGAYVERRHSEGGWNKVAGQLRALYRWAIATGRLRLKAVPFQVELLPVSLGARGVLWPEQVQAFLAGVDRVRKEHKGDPVPQAGIAARLMIGLGLRENEALNLEWDRLDWRRHVAIIAMAATTGRKVKDRTAREIPIPRWLEAYLLAWWAHCQRPATGLVLVARRGGAHHDGAAKKATLIGGAAAGVPGLTPHGLRRTYATNLFETGTDVNQIADWMGHDDPRLTLERYILKRPRPASLEAMEKAGAAMGFYPQSPDSPQGLTTTQQVKVS